MTPHQRGSALVFSLVILLVMTMIGITALGTSTLEEKMAANDRNQRVAFQAAEAALREGETQLSTHTQYRGTGGLKDNFTATGNGYYENEDQVLNSGWTAGTECLAVTVHGYNNSTPGCYKVEEIGFIMPIEPPEYPFQRVNQISRVSARSADANDQTAVTVQSYYRLELTNPQSN